MKKEIPWNLIISKLKQEITVDGNQQFMEWLSDSTNKEVFDELEQVWQKVQARSSAYTPDNQYYWSELSSRMKTREIKPKIGKYIHSASHSFLRYAAIICIIISSAFAFYQIGIQKGRPELAKQVYTTLGGKSTILLPDGTEVWLHSQTQLAYSTDYKEKNRCVNILGEAYFNVTHDANKPFIVQTEGMSIVVRGTKFNVESFPNSEKTFVSLLEGSVVLETTAEKRFLNPGEVATFNKRSNKLQIEKGDVDFTTSWANNKIVFTEKSLGYVCRFLSKWYHIKINLSPQLEDKHLYTFTLRDEPLEEILRLMSFIHEIKYQFNDENVLTISKE